MLLTRSIGRSPSLVKGATSSSSSSLTLRLEHDVFLSFYGKDTRHNFTDHLFAALKRNSIAVFRDAEGLRRGTFINSGLRKAIKESKIAIVVLSKNYAFSRWCLSELAQIVACIKETGIKVIPVFYHVDPSNVRQQNGTFALAFANHKKDSGVKSEKIQAWENALKCVGGIAGFVLQDHISESTVIQRISGDIHRELYGGAFPEATFGEVFKVLHDTVKNVGSKVLMFKSFFKNFEFNLYLLAPVVEEINEKLDCPEQETQSLIKKMKTAKQLIHICSETQESSKFYRIFATKLIELDEAIVRFCKVQMQAQNRGDILQILEQWKPTREEMKLPILMIDSLSCSVPRPLDFPVGLDIPLKELKTQLLKEKEQQILLTAPGGCGKTALVTMLGHDQEIKGKFEDYIFFVPVSKTLNLMVIVQRLFHNICYREPEFLSDEDAINQLQDLLTRIGSSPILLILDDVRPGSEFRLEMLMIHVPNLNILVTSRTSFPGFSFTYNLKPLNDEDATTLLRHTASLQAGSSHIPVVVIKKIVRATSGFPLALRVNGRTLCEKSVEAWHSRARNLSNGHSIFNYSSDLLECLQRSLEFSDHEVILRKCFMDLGSFHEDQRIPVLGLTYMWAELYKLDEDGFDAIANLHELTTRNLANLSMIRKDASEINNYYNEYYVTQHDLLRKLAIFQSCQGPEGQRQRLIMDISGNSLPSWCTEQDQQPINARLLSISTDELFLSNWCNIQAPKVEVLVLNLQTKNYSLPEFVDKMDNLKVLIITNYGFFPTELRNFQLLNSLSNLKAIRLEKVSIPSLCKDPVFLKSLKRISLFMCNIGQAFENCTVQVSDALPNLMEINIDYCNDLVELPAVLCDVILLKKLIITNCHQLSSLPKGIGKLVNLEVLRLRSCTDLSELPESIKSLNKLRLLDISDCLGIRHLPKDIGELCNLKELYMKGCLSLRKGLPPSTTNLEQLKLVECDEERAKFWEPFKEVLTNLEVKVAEKDINLNWLLKP
ncbi:probable disease resistance protein At5g66900 isoform X2 [Quercus suber]|uniref:probable disease resistance protein At5g66900 isoform X2 n=1 Tax=Quercus suber TaxID=58331 RepID=UPI000CE16AFB|nr:probable disease resistance protein At5g66900 isoform X2 [Quercus suber]POE48470.1 putative disease resistance protein [Quercus suber]